MKKISYEKLLELESKLLFLKSKVKVFRNQDKLDIIQELIKKSLN